MRKGKQMTEQEDEQKFCLEIAEFPGADMPWLTEKARAIEEAMGERLPGMFLWHSVVAHPEIDGIRVFFQIDPDSDGIDETVPGTLIDIIREIAGDDLPGSDPIAA